MKLHAWGAGAVLRPSRRKVVEMALSKAMNAKLNEQITNEFYASQLYLAIACMFDDLSLKMLAKLYRKQTEEEREHALKILDYILSVGGKVKLQAIAEPTAKFANVQAAIGAALEHELKVTDQIHALVALAEKDKDYATQSFLRWFVDEQVEEVESQRYLLDVAKMAGDRLLQLEAAVSHLLK
jgi:ferritin